ncbi:hypothetical protein THAOC_20205, partial [Thalassiosira oceanica]
MKIEVADRPGKWLYGEPSAWGSRNGPPSDPGRPVKRVFVENSAVASVRECPLSAKRGPRRTSSCRTRPVVRIGRKVASRKALVELYKSHPIDEFGSTELALALARKAAQRDDSRDTQTGCRVVSKRHPARCSDDSRPTQLARGRRGREERHAAYCGGGRSARYDGRGGGASSCRPGTASSIDPPPRPPAGDVIPPPFPPRPSLRGTAPLALRARSASAVTS